MRLGTWRAQFAYNIRFPGQYYQPETGLNQNLNRDYDPLTGRYIESDPIGLRGGLNTYAYVGGQPVGRIDPFGLADVYIWNYQGSEAAWGHASVDAGSTHISWWPGPPETRDYTGPSSASIYDAPAFPNQTLPDDISYEGGLPDSVIHLDNLDDAAIRRWWKQFKKTHKNWKTLSQNCSTTAAEALEAGGADNRVLNFPKPLVWTPAAVRAYAEAIQQAGNGTYDYAPFSSPQ